MKKNLKNTVAEVLVEGLEVSNETVVETTVDFSSREYLESNKPEFELDLVSKKYDAEREPKVQDGLLLIAELMGDKINPLLLLLAKWWEVKPARSAIKKMIDEEAKANNQAEDVYLQIVLRENVDKLAQIAQAVDRLKYSITYFKPRAGVGAKEIFKTMSISGIIYNVSLTKLAEAKVTFGEDKEALKDYLKSVSTMVETVEEL